MKPSHDKPPFKKPCKKYSYKNGGGNRKPYTHKVICRYCSNLEYTKHYCHIRKFEVSEGVMMQVPKNYTCAANLQGPNFYYNHEKVVVHS